MNSEVPLVAHNDSSLWNICCEKGELYLFHPSNPHCPSQGSLWAVLAGEGEHGLLLESSSLDLQCFERWHMLPDLYRYARRATRDELRDYVYNLARYDLMDSERLR